MPATLYYIHDPMCSWCWGFKPVWTALESRLVAESVQVVYLVGGLAPDTDALMPESLQQTIQSHWHKIERLLGTSFNYDFWRVNTPRRSTYPSCRAVLVAKQLGLPCSIDLERPMIEGIQHAYYLSAKNPSDDEVLFEVFESVLSHCSVPNRAETLERFKALLNHPDTFNILNADIHNARILSNQGFPSLVLVNENHSSRINIDYAQVQPMMDQIHAALTV